MDLYGPARLTVFIFYVFWPLFDIEKKNQKQESKKKEGL